LYIKKTIDRVSQGRVCVKSASLKFSLHTASIQLNGLNISNERDLKENLYAKMVSAEIKIRPLLNKELVCDNIIVTEPQIKFPFSFKKTGSPKRRWKYTFKKLEAEGGNICWHNVQSGFSIKNFHLVLNDFSLTSPFPFSLKGNAVFGEKRSYPIDFIGNAAIEKNCVNVEIEKGIYDDIKIVTPHLPIYLKDKTLHIRGVKLKMAEGEAELSGKLKFSPQRDIEFDSVYETKNIDVQKLVSKFGIENLTFSGALDCKGNIRSYGKTIDERIKNLNGSLDIILNNGYLTRQHILVRMLTLINMYDVIKLRVPKMDKEGIKYDTATVKAVIDSGIINVESLYIDGDRIRISGKGNIDLVKKSTNMVFGLKFFQIIDEVLNKIPIVGYIVTGEDGNLFAFYVRLKNGKDGLKATVVPHELLEDVTIRLFQRLLKLPLRMMTPVTKYISKKKNVKNRR
jgi:hypothetical protein